PSKTTGGQYDWGAITFAAGSQYESQLINLDITGGGYDGRDGAIVVDDTQTNTPLLEDLTFDDCNTSAIRFRGKGINTLHQDGLKLPSEWSKTTFVFER